MENDVPVLDMKDVLDRVQNDRELLLELLEIFQEDFLRRRKMLKKGLDQKDALSVREAAHAIKGAAGNISAKRIFSLCYEMEKAAQAEDLQAVDKNLSSLDEEFQALRRYIKTIQNS